METNDNRDHLFISYATEDWAIADWLTRKLTAEGFRVWCDRFQLLGGESYPKEIDDAIKNRTFRLLALLSRDSISKPNPVKERTLALNLGKERKTDFLIPLNVDGLRPTDLDWMTSDLTFISFFESWAAGLKKLLRKLNSISAPRLLQNGKEIAASTFLPPALITEKSETLLLNLVPFLKVPEFIKKYRSNRSLNWSEIKEIVKTWPLFRIDEHEYLSFQTLPVILPAGIEFTYIDHYSWEDLTNIKAVPIRNVVSFLLRKSLQQKCLEKGLKLAPDGETLFFPGGILSNNKIHFTNYNGQNTWIQVTGERTIKIKDSEVQKYIYHLCPEFKVRQALYSGFAAQLRIKLYFTDFKGNPLRPHSASARRKRITRAWWNHQWLSRQIAFLSFLADKKESIEIGDSPDGQVIVSSGLLEYNAPFGIAEEIPTEVPAEVLEAVLAEDDPETEIPDFDDLKGQGL